MKSMQAFILSEGKVIFAIEDGSILEALISLIATYYVFFVSYPKPAPASGLLLFVQEVLMGKKEPKIKKSVRYSSFINSILS